MTMKADISGAAGEEDTAEEVLTEEITSTAVQRSRRKKLSQRSQRCTAVRSGRIGWMIMVS